MDLAGKYGPPGLRDPVLAERDLEEGIMAREQYELIAKDRLKASGAIGRYRNAEWASLAGEKPLGRLSIDV